MVSCSRVLNGSAGLSSLLVALFVVLLSKAYLTSPSKMSSSTLVITPSWLSRSLWLFFRKKKKMEDNCFTMFFWFLPYILINHPYVYMCFLPLEAPSSCPSLSQSTRFLNPWIMQEISTDYLILNIAIYIYISMLLSWFVPLPPSPAGSTSLFMSASPLLPCK